MAIGNRITRADDRRVCSFCHVKSIIGHHLMVTILFACYLWPHWNSNVVLCRVRCSSALDERKQVDFHFIWLSLHDACQRPSYTRAVRIDGCASKKSYLVVAGYCSWPWSIRFWISFKVISPFHNSHTLIAIELPWKRNPHSKHNTQILHSKV